MNKPQITVCLLLFSLAAFAQTDRGTITGTVSDATGAVIPGATIEAKNAATGAVYQAGSSETGNYTLVELPAGTYELSAKLAVLTPAPRAAPHQVPRSARPRRSVAADDHSNSERRYRRNQFPPASSVSYQRRRFSM